MEDHGVKTLHCGVRIQNFDGKSEHNDSIIEHCDVTIQHGEGRIQYRGIAAEYDVDDTVAHCDSTGKKS